MSQQIFSPIFVSVHTREKHFRKCIESLQKCTDAKSTELYVSSDYYRNDEEKESVLSIRKYINSLKGFKKINPIFFNKNVGLDHASRYSFNIIFNLHDSIIIMEDDIEVSRLFLKYMNKALNFYKNEPNVFSICGYSPFLLGNNYFEHDYIFKGNGWNGWGFGIWKTKFNSFLDFRDSSELFSDIKINIGSGT